jgi:hypothetical protein
MLWLCVPCIGLALPPRERPRVVRLLFVRELGALLAGAPGHVLMIVGCCCVSWQAGWLAGTWDENDEMAKWSLDGGWVSNAQLATFKSMCRKNRSWELGARARTAARTAVQYEVYFKPLVVDNQHHSRLVRLAGELPRVRARIYQLVVQQEV